VNALDRKVEFFAREFPRRSRVLNCAGKLRSPSAQTIRAVVYDFERTQLVVSRDGQAADIAAQWCTVKHQEYQLAWSPTYGAWILRAVSLDQIEAML
jgi:hypothetical protein